MAYMEKQDAFNQLKNLLLEEDHLEHELLVKQVKELEESINTRKRLQQKVDPIIEEKLNILKDKFPEVYGHVITKTIKTQIRESRDEVIDALYPIMGKLIQKYVVAELTALSEKIDQQMNQMFSWEAWWIRIKSWLGGQSQGSQVLARSMLPQIEEVFVIRQQSGTLIGNYSRSGKLQDSDMVASMLTAIKCFVKESFVQEHQELEVIEYATYKIFIKNFQTFYVAVTLSGIVGMEAKKRVDNLILDFAQMYMQEITVKDIEEEGHLSVPLTQFFTNTKL